MLQFCTNSYALLNTTCNHHMQPAAAQWRSKKQQQKQQILFCKIFRFQTHPVSDFFSTMNCRNKRHGCLCAANYCLRTSRSLVLRNQAFAACVGFCVVPRPIKHMSVISRFRSRCRRRHCHSRLTGRPGVLVRTHGSPACRFPRHRMRSAIGHTAFAGCSAVCCPPQSHTGHGGWLRGSLGHAGRGTCVGGGSLRTTVRTPCRTNPFPPWIFCCTAHSTSR